MTSVFPLRSDYTSTQQSIKATKTERAPSDVLSQSTDPSDRFHLPQRKDYQQQYYNIYCSRLAQYKPFFATQIQTILEKEHNSIENNLDIEPVHLWENIPDAKPGQMCVIMGLSYKSADKKPSVLESVNATHQKADNSIWKLHQPKLTSIVSPSITRTDTKIMTEDVPLEQENAFKNSITLKNIHPNDMNIINTKSYIQPQDIIFLEDRSGRVPLVFQSYSRMYRGTMTESSPLYTQQQQHQHQQLNAPFSYLDEQINQSHFVSGQILAVQGHICESTGEFLVSRVFTPALHYQPLCQDLNPNSDDGTSLSTSMADAEHDINDAYTVLLSGINLSATTAPSNEYTKLHRFYIDSLLDLLTGNLTSNETECDLFSKITHCIIAGDLIGATPPDAQDNLLPNRAAVKKTTNIMQSKDKQITTTSAIRLADLFLTKLCTSLQVYLLPGLHDPTNYSIPQQAFNPCLLPSASTFTSFNCITNPAQIVINNDTYLGTDGSNIVDITRSSCHSFLSGLGLVAQTQHLFPTSPDTLGCYPYQDTDPMLFINDTITMNAEQNETMTISDQSRSVRKNLGKIQTTDVPTQPQIIFAGNAPHFQTATVQLSTKALFEDEIENTKQSSSSTLMDNISKKVQLVCIPNFSTTASFVLMNQRTKQCIPIYLGDMLTLGDDSNSSTTLTSNVNASFNESNGNDITSSNRSVNAKSMSANNINPLDNIQVMLHLMNLQSVGEEEHASIEFGEDDEEMGMGGGE